MMRFSMIKLLKQVLQRPLLRSIIPYIITELIVQIFLTLHICLSIEYFNFSELWLMFMFFSYYQINILPTTLYGKVITVWPQVLALGNNREIVKDFFWCYKKKMTIENPTFIQFLCISKEVNSLAWKIIMNACTESFWQYRH
jgi:hypothetical protein